MALSGLLASPALGALWTHVYTPTALPEDYAPGPWMRDDFFRATDSVALQGGRLCLDLDDDSEVLWFRDSSMDPALGRPEMTVEWSHEAVAAGVWDLFAGDVALSYSEDHDAAGQIVFQSFLFQDVELDPVLGLGRHVYRIVRRASGAELWVDGTLVATAGRGFGAADYAEFHFWGFRRSPAPYRGCTSHVAYADGAFTPAELPSPGGDTTAPAAVADLAVTGASTNTLTLSWTAPGDDANTGTAASYDLRFTTAGPIASEANFVAAAQAAGAPAPQAAGGAETFALSGLAPGTTYFFALKTLDEAGNASALSNSPSGLTARAGFVLSISTGNEQVGTVTKASRISMTVKVVDAQGAAVAGTTITFSTSAAPSGAAGHGLSVISTTTAQDGTASTALTFGNRVGTYTVTATCAGCAPSAVIFTAVAELRLVISLSMDSIRPAGTETSPTQPRTTLLVTAAGVSVPSDRVANYPIVLVSTPVAFSGGHDHDDDRPTGSFEVPGNPSVFTTNTGIDGSFLLSYVSTATGGRELITANSVVDTRVQTTTRTVIVEVPWLVLLPATTFYAKVGGTCLHHGPSDNPAVPASCRVVDNNHFGLSGFNNSIERLAARYAARFPGHRLRINDMGLPNGGLFDISAGWRKPHKYHRLGTSADINSNSGLNRAPDSLEEKFLKTEVAALNLLLHRETDHWHIYLTGGGP